MMLEAEGIKRGDVEAVRDSADAVDDFLDGFHVGEDGGVRVRMPGAWMRT